MFSIDKSGCHIVVPVASNRILRTGATQAANYGRLSRISSGLQFLITSLVVTHGLNGAATADFGNFDS